jgi:hypothetical protein|tara:strand:+ start:474 stop:977 length:504 start_codon:yes stop_codon:yes gene_type:complete
MANGWNNQLTKQVGEYLAAAELCRRGFVAATFSGNVPHYDILASNEAGVHMAVQVKAILRIAWQFDVTKFVDVQLEGKKQVIGGYKPAPYPNLVCIFIRLAEYGKDEFYILEWESLQKLAVYSHCRYLERHGYIRPKKPDSMHLSIDTNDLREYKDNWSVLSDRVTE